MSKNPFSVSMIQQTVAMIYREQYLPFFDALDAEEKPKDIMDEQIFKQIFLHTLAMEAQSRKDAKIDLTQETFQEALYEATKAVIQTTLAKDALMKDPEAKKELEEMLAKVRTSMESMRMAMTPSRN